MHKFMMQLRTRVIVSLVAILSFGIVSADAAVKAGFIYVGPVADGGWTYEHDQGSLAVEKAY